MPDKKKGEGCEKYEGCEGFCSSKSAGGLDVGKVAEMIVDAHVIERSAE
jgi:hypothetical protein